jgi:hypothetical protein
METVIPTRRPLLSRLMARAQAWHLRLLLRAAENDHEYHHTCLHMLPLQIDAEAKYIAELRVQLIDMENRT